MSWAQSQNCTIILKLELSICSTLAKWSMYVIYSLCIFESQILDPITSSCETLSGRSCWIMYLLSKIACQHQPPRHCAIFYLLLAVSHRTSPHLPHSLIHSVQSSTSAIIFSNAKTPSLIKCLNYNQYNSTLPCQILILLDPLAMLLTRVFLRALDWLLRELQK